MNNMAFPKVWNEIDVYREFFGEPGKVNISPRSEGFVDTAMKSVDSWTNDNQYKDGLRYALGKQAEMGERFGIPTSRMIQGVTLRPRDISTFPNASGYYLPTSDTIHLPEPVDIYKMIKGSGNKMDMDLLRLYLHSLLTHEHDHYLLAHSLGRPFESELQKTHQTDKITKPSNNRWGWSSFYRKPYMFGLVPYGAEDFGRGYPSEEIPEISRAIASGKGLQQPHRLLRAAILKRRMLQSLHKQGMVDIPNPTKDLYDDIYGKGPVTANEEANTINTVKQAMKKLAGAKEVLRNVLAFKQNQNMGLAWLATHQPGSGEVRDFELVRDINSGMGITAPAFDSGWDQAAFIEGLHQPVNRSVDPLMHGLAKAELVDPNSGKNINNIWLTPIGSWDHIPKR